MARTRKIGIAFKPKSGMFDRFYAFVNGRRVLAAGPAGGSWSDELAEGDLRIKVRVFGGGAATYAFTLDMPGDQADLEASRTLADGYDEFEVRT